MRNKHIRRLHMKILAKLETFFVGLVTFLIFVSSIYIPSVMGQSLDQKLDELNFPIMGTETLKDPDWYEQAGLITKATITLTNQEPAKVEELDKTYLGFSLLSETPDDLEGVNFKVRKTSGEYSPLLIIEKADTSFGDGDFDIADHMVSELYIFTGGIDRIEFYYGGDKKFTVQKVDINSQIGDSAIKPQEYASTNAERDYKEKLFAGLGFNIIAREEWGAPTQSTWSPKVVDVNRIVVHHTATSVDMANPKNTVMAVYNYHYNRCANNSGSYDPSNPNCDETHELWQDIGYNYLIDPYGNIYEGRSGGNAVVGAHAIPNTGSIGISLLGNFTSQNATQAAYTSLTKLIFALSELNDFNPQWHGGDPTSATGVYGHRNLAATACPGNYVYDYLDEISGYAQQLKDTDPALKTVKNTSRSLTQNRNFADSDSGNAQLMLDITQATGLQQEKLLTTSRGVADITQIGDTVFYSAPQVQLNQIIAETMVVAPNTQIQPNFEYELTTWDNTDPDRSIPSDYNTTTHWNMEDIKAPEAWKDLGGCSLDNTCGGDPSVIVAILDTGVAHENFDYDAGGSYPASSPSVFGLYMEVPGSATPNGIYNEGYDRQYDLASELGNVNFVAPYDAVQDYFCALRNATATGTDDCNVAELAKVNHANDDFGHGTFIASIIAGDTSDAAPNKVVGIAHNVSIMPVKVFYPNDTSVCETSAGAQDRTCADPNYDFRVVGDTYVISQAIDYAVTNGADVINLSLRGFGTDPTMHSAIKDAVNAGVTVVASSGNDNDDLNNYFPASFPEVITVGASDAAGNRASYSNFGSGLDLVAPVGDSSPSDKIASFTYDCFPSIDDCSDETDANLFQTFTSTSTPTVGTGTSYSAPQVAAAVALIKSVRSDPSPAQIRDFLIHEATTDLGPSGWDPETGWGALDLEKVLSSAMNGFSREQGFVCGTGCWSLNNDSEPVSGDFDGDGDDDVAVMYQYGSSTIRIWLFTSDGAGGFIQSEGYFCGPGCWNMLNSSNLAVGDFDNDGDDDLAAMYQYSNSAMRIWIFNSDGAGSFTREEAFVCGSGCWNMKNASNLVAGDFDNDNDDDIAVMYQYGSSTIRIWGYESDGSNNFTSSIYYFCGPGCWNMKNSINLTSGDFNADSFDDLATIYQYSSTTIRIWNFFSSGSGSFSSSIGHLCGPGCWNTANSGNIVSGNFDNDGDDDLAIMYQYSGSTIRLWNFVNNGTGNYTRKRWYYCDTGCWNMKNSPDIVVGNFVNDAKVDIASMYQYYNYAMRIWTFPSIIYP